MAAILELTTGMVVRRGSDAERIGRVDEPYFLSIDGDMVRKDITLAASGSGTVYNGGGDEEWSDISFLAVRSEYDAVVEMTFDTADSYGTTYQTNYVEGSGESGRYGPWHVFPNCQAYANYTANFAAGTLVYCDYVRVLNTDSSNATKVQVVYGE